MGFDSPGGAAAAGGKTPKTALKSRLRHRLREKTAGADNDTDPMIMTVDLELAKGNPMLSSTDDILSPNNSQHDTKSVDSIDVGGARAAGQSRRGLRLLLDVLILQNLKKSFLGHRCTIQDCIYIYSCTQTLHFYSK